MIENFLTAIEHHQGAAMAVAFVIVLIITEITQVFERKRK